MIYTELTAKAARIACRAHADALDRGNMPYIFHPFTVASQMEDETAAAAALLHDVLEDTELTARDLLAEGIPRRVAELVETLTRRDGEDYFDYIARIARDREAAVIKLADLRHNGDLSRIAEPNEDDVRRAEKYKAAQSMLLDSLLRD